MSGPTGENVTARCVAEWYERCPTCGSYEVVRRLTTQPHGPGTSFRFCDDEWHEHRARGAAARQPSRAAHARVSFVNCGDSPPRAVLHRNQGRGSNG